MPSDQYQVRAQSTLDPPGAKFIVIETEGVARPKIRVNRQPSILDKSFEVNCEDKFAKSP